MSRDYMTFFEPVPLGRGEILRRAASVLHAHGIRYTGSSAALSWHVGLQEYLERGADLQLATIDEAAMFLDDHDGISLNFIGPHGSMSVFLWPDRVRGHAVLHLWEESSSFLHHVENEEQWRGYEDVLLDLAEQIDAGFVVSGISTPRNTIHAEDLSRILAQIGKSGPERWLVLVMVHSRLIPVNAVAVAVAAGCRLQVRDGYSVVVDPFYGPGEEQ